MAKRRSKKLTPARQQVALTQRRNMLLGILWAFVVIIAVLFGYFNGYPIVAAGQTFQGILVGLLYGGGALLALVFAFYLNRKLRGL